MRNFKGIFRKILLTRPDTVFAHSQHCRSLHDLFPSKVEKIHSRFHYSPELLKDCQIKTSDLSRNLVARRS